jgi:hypothetical protein
MSRLQLPAHVEAVLHHFFTCEFTTLSKDSTPITWPLLPIYWAERGQFAIFTSIGLPQKALNVRRNPHVSLYWSDPTGSDLATPPAVLVQGDADCPDSIPPSLKGLDPDLLAALKAQARKLLRRQPGMKLYLSNAFSRYLMEWYFMRLLITVTPRRIWWWERGDRSRAPQVLEVTHVA